MRRRRRRPEHADSDIGADFEENGAGGASSGKDRNARAPERILKEVRTAI